MEDAPDNQTPHRWYISAAAMRDYLAIAGYVDDDGGDNWQRAEQALAEHAASARATDSTTRSGAVIYRSAGKVEVGDPPRKTRLEFTVSHAERDEGELPQLLRVREKGSGHRGGGQEQA